MYNTKLTRKDVTNFYHGRTFRCGYCDLQYLTNGLDRIGYNTGIYGWNWDCFAVGGVAVVTGYRNMVGKDIPLEIIEKYNKKAKETIKENGTYKQQQEKLDILREEFAKELVNL